MTSEAILMDREQVFWKCAHEVAAFTADPLKSFQALLSVHQQDFPNHDPAQAEAKLRGILRLES